MPTFKKLAKRLQKKAKTQRKQPGIEARMQPKPKIDEPRLHQRLKLKNKVAIITGGDSGIGHSVAIFFAKAGADIVITYLNEHKDAKNTQKQIQQLGRRCLRFAGDVGKEKFCRSVIKNTIKEFGKIDILINNAAEQHEKTNFLDISAKQLIKTFTTNVFGYFYMIKACLPYLKKDSCIINTTSVTAYKGNDHLIDYSASKGAIVSLTRSLSQSLVKKGIRVNGVAPGPVWTPLIPASFSKSHIKKFGKNVPMQRPAQPEEIAGCYLFLASPESSYITGQILHPNGGVIVNG